MRGSCAVASALLFCAISALFGSQDTTITTALLDSAATIRSVKYDDATYENARSASVGETKAVEFAVFNSDSSGGDYRVSRGFLMFDLTGFPEASIVDSARLYMRLIGVVDKQDSDSTHVIEGTYTGGYAASDSVAFSWYNDFTGWVDISGGPSDTSYSGVVNYTEPFVQDSSDTGWQSVLFTQVGLDTLKSYLGNDTLRAVLINGQDIADIVPNQTTRGLTSWDSNPASYIPYLTIYYQKAVYDTIISAVSGGLTLTAPDSLDWQVRDSTHASAYSTSSMGIGMWRSNSGNTFNVRRTALTFDTYSMDAVDSIISVSFFIYPSSITDSLDLVPVRGTFSDTIALDWFNDFNGWKDGSPHTVSAFSDSVRLVPADTGSWKEIVFDSAGRALVKAAMSVDSLRIMLLASNDINRDPYPDSASVSYFGTISHTNKPYLKIAYTSTTTPAVITNKDVDTLHVSGSDVYLMLGGRIDSVGAGLDSVGFKYYIKGNEGDSSHAVIDSASATWSGDSFYVRTAVTDTLTIDTTYVVTAFAVHTVYRIYSTVNDTVSTAWGIPTEWRSISTLPDTSIHANPVRALWPDSSGCMWWGTAMGLYKQSSDTTASRYVYDDSSYAQKSRNNIMAGTGLANGNVYTGSLIGLTLHKDATFSADSQITAALPDSAVMVLVKDSADAEQIWLASDSLVYLWGDTVGSIFNTDSGLIGLLIHDIVIDSVGSVWIATNSGVSRLWENYWIDYTTSNSSLLGNGINAMVVAGNDSSVWFGGDDGLIRFDGDSTWTEYTDSIASRKVRALTYSPSAKTIAIATDSGLTIYQKNTPGTYSSWRNYYPGSTNDSLPRYELFSVAADSAGRVWIGHSTGVTRLKETF